MELVIELMQKNQESNKRKRAKGIIKEDELRKQLHEAKRRRKKTREEMKEKTLRIEALKGELRIYFFLDLTLLFGFLIPYFLLFLSYPSSLFPYFYLLTICFASLVP